MLTIIRTLLLGITLSTLALSQLLPSALASNAPPFGPYNGQFIASGLGYKSTLSRAVAEHWTISCWFLSTTTPTRTLLGGIGNGSASDIQRYLAIDSGKISFWIGSAGAISGDAAVITAGQWHFAAASYDGKAIHLWLDGNALGQKAVSLAGASREVHVAPEQLPWPDAEHFGGKIASFTVTDNAASDEEIRASAGAHPNPDLIVFDTPSHDWPVQSREQAGYRSPQNPATLPKSAAPFSTAVAKPIENPVSTLAPRGPNEWAIQGGWKLAAAVDVTSDEGLISMPGFDTRRWLAATVPGTVLTTYIDRGVYPDPDFGLNNLAIPEKLSRQNYWYRVDFMPPKDLRRHVLTLTFEGINYAAAVWLNGQRIGNIKGAFVRGQFNVSELVRLGEPNALAVLISPPIHPGIPHEQSVSAGPGENGGIQCLDGPTFVATEGWDWIPGIRDRNSGIWQEVTLRATEAVRMGDPQVITALPLPDTSRADVLIAVPIHNDADQPVSGVLEASFEGVRITKRVNAEPGNSVVRLTPAEFQELSVEHPRLWWPNGYGRPDLYHLNLAFRVEGHVSDTKALRFGIREITYELSLLDHTGHLRRVDLSPTEALGQPLVNVTHEGIIQTAQGWVPSLTHEGEVSPAVHAVSDTKVAPFLAIKVNGVRIACKGGSWGMDDSRKRVSRAHLEPFFRLHRDANLNIIRNWVGQDTEATFYDLADEYGLLIWNDFWDSTQNYNVEPDDSALFLANARDVILRFRNHPSIAIWCGRNEGVPAPAVNKGLDDLIRTLDGTRYYAPDSNSVSLQNSGPYRLFPLSEYFTKHARGFAVELGIPSMPTIDAFKAFVAPADQWPPNDVWAYHDWHASGNGVITPFMDTIAEQYGPGKDLVDFERKAQLLNYDAHRAIFEGFNAHLWNPNSGRMLWMTQPAWPSTMWQILSSDYDTQASYYAVKKASEPIHVQMNLPDLMLVAVNNTVQPITNATLRARIFSSAGAELSTHEEKLTVGAASEQDSFRLTIPEAAANDVVFVKLELLDGSGKLLSENFYTQAAQPATYQQLNSLPSAPVTGTGKWTRNGDMARINLELMNSGNSVSLMTKLTLRSAANGARILPAYYAENYISLLPGEKRSLTIEAPAGSGAMRVDITGWNAAPFSISVAP